METSPLSILVSLVAGNPAAADGRANTLSAAKVRNTKPTEKPIKLPDGGGLALYIPPTGAKTWRYRFRLEGKEQTLTIGSYPEISLESARQAHRGARWLVERGIAPLDYIKKETARLTAEEKARELNTFEAVCKKWLEATDSGLASRTAKHRRAMLDNHVMQAIGSRAIADIRRRDLTELLTKLDQKAPEVAKHCRTYIKQVFDYALDQELVTGNPIPPATVLVNRAKTAVIPRKALPIKRLGAFIKALNDAPDTDPLTKAAMKLLILTWTRTSEVVGAMWAEVDLDNAVWRIPAERMKAGEVHAVYLSAQVIELLLELQKLTGTSKHLFPNRRRPDTHMSRTTLFQWRVRFGFKDVMDVHGFRAVGSTWANESGDYRSDVIEVALAHKESDRVRAAYNRAKFFEELKVMWQAWADLCDQKETAARAENVVTGHFGKAVA